MTIGVSYDVIRTIVINIVFDDESVKTREIKLNDNIDITFAKDGKRRTISGYVKRIETDNPCRKKEWYIIVDTGSAGTVYRMEKILVDNIIDLEVLSSADASVPITSTIGESKISNFRLVGKVLQLSQDGGRTWLKVTDLPDTDITVDPTDLPLVDEIKNIIPDYMRPDIKAELMEDILNLVKSKECKCDDCKSEGTDSSDSSTDITGGTTV